MGQNVAMTDHSDADGGTVNRRRVLRAAGAAAAGTAGLVGTAGANENASDDPITYINFCGCSAYCLCTTNSDSLSLVEPKATLYTVPQDPPNGSTYEPDDVDDTVIGNGCDEPGGKVVVICVDGSYYCNEANCATNEAEALGAVKEKLGDDFDGCANDQPNAVITNNEGGCGQPIGPCGDGRGDNGNPEHGPPDYRIRP